MIKLFKVMIVMWHLSGIWTKSTKSFQKTTLLFFEMIMSIIFWFFGFTLVLTPFVTF